jgi:hypothetical protein
MAKRLRAAGTLIIAGLLVEGFSLFWNHPLSFIAFLGIGGLLIFVGVVIYLVALVSPRPSG